MGDLENYWCCENGFLVWNHLVGRLETHHANEFPIAIRLDEEFPMVQVNGPHQSCGRVWVGKTLYPLTKEAAEARGVHYAGDLTKKFAAGGHFR